MKAIIDRLTRRTCSLLNAFPPQENLQLHLRIRNIITTSTRVLNRTISDEVHRKNDELSKILKILIPILLATKAGIRVAGYSSGALHLIT